ncbi:glycosyltransferase [Crateriforma conspicua]|uniref:glycosyltransferase n=1 Tax=Crateriforma conspicua TaxID=2527996 RepID=UPI0011B794AC|nr:glycosyltransferase [Crateriforma conspicua]
MQRIGAVPLTPFEPLADEPIRSKRESVQAYRRKFCPDYSGSGLVFGRVGRQHVHKWTKDSANTIDKLLSRFPGSQWLSVGFPPELGLESLKARWGTRFINFPETSDYSFICQALSCLDVHIFSSPYGECFASSIVESTGIGVPTIAVSRPYRDNGQAEQVIDGKTGFLVADDNGILSKIALLSKNPDLLNHLKNESRNYTRNHWHADIVADKLLQLYQAWREDQPSLDRFPILAEQLEDALRFREFYRSRMKALHGAGPITGAMHHTQSKLARTWVAHRFVAKAKRMMRR